MSLAEALDPDPVSGWVRVCGECGQFDLHSLVPTACMVERPNWRYGVCDATDLTAAHVQYLPYRHNTNNT